MERLLLKEIVECEDQLGLYERTVLGVPFWRLVRFKTRTRFLNRKTGFKYYTKPKRICFYTLAKNVLLSCSQFRYLFFSRSTHIENIIFAFPRLHKVNDIFLDKFSDPVINNSGLQKDFLIIQKPQAGRHQAPRCHEERTIITDFIEVIAHGGSVIFFPVIFFVFLSTLRDTYGKAKKYFRLDYKFLIFSGKKIGSFVIFFIFYYFLFKKIRPKRIFVVDREIFFPIILACKKLNIVVYEFQHGVTHDETPLYSGSYDSRIDPDYFLTFGDAWVGPQFGMPENKIINIGWAYKTIMSNYCDLEKKSDKYVLVISEPNKSEKILNAIVTISLLYREYTFHIRLHPQESYNEQQLRIVDKYEQITVQDNLMESAIALKPYNTILGENSTVLYEALSYGKRVGRLSFTGLESEFIADTDSAGFIYLNEINDFGKLMESSTMEFLGGQTYFSGFQAERVNNLL